MKSFMSFIHYATIDTTVKPESLTIQAVNATSVDVTWSNNPCVSTSLTYTSYFTGTGSVVSQRELILPPEEAATVMNISERNGYGHNFSVHFIMPDDQMATITSKTFSFGKLSISATRCG